MSGRSGGQRLHLSVAELSPTCPQSVTSRSQHRAQRRVGPVETKGAIMNRPRTALLIATKLPACRSAPALSAPRRPTTLAERWNCCRASRPVASGSISIRLTAATTPARVRANGFRRLFGGGAATASFAYLTTDKWKGAGIQRHHMANGNALCFCERLAISASHRRFIGHGEDPASFGPKISCAVTVRVRGAGVAASAGKQI